MKNQYIEVIYLEDFGISKKGEIQKMNIKDAIAIVKEGICEYVKQPNELNKKIQNQNNQEITQIPESLQKPNFNFVLINPNGDGKNPKGLGWQKKIWRFDNPELISHIKARNNYGVQGNNSFVEIGDKT